MTREEKELLVKDIFGRVLTGLKVNYNGEIFTLGYNLYLEDGNTAFESFPMKFYLEGIETIKPYLRPMSSIRGKEWEELNNLRESAGYIGSDYTYLDVYDWYNAHYIDYRGLIPKGLALEAPEGMYTF